MPKNTQLATSVINEQADVLGRKLDGGVVRIYSGTQPANANTALTSQVLLAEFVLPNPSAPAAVNGLLSLATIPSTIAVATGTARWFRCLTSGGAPVLDGSAGLATDNPNLSLPVVDFVSGSQVFIDAFAHTVARATNGY